MTGAPIPELALAGKNPFVPERLDVEKFDVKDVSFVQTKEIRAESRSLLCVRRCFGTNLDRGYGTSETIDSGCPNPTSIFYSIRELLEPSKR